MQRIQDSYRDLSQILEELRSLQSGTTILVEGRKDEQALRKLDIKAPIIRFHSLKPLFELLSGFDQVVILTDYDREGRRLAYRCENIARSFGVVPNLEFRRRIEKATFGEISHMEGLHTYFTNLNMKVLGSYSSNRRK